MSTSIIVPFRGTCPHRVRAHLLVRAFLEGQFPEAEILDVDDGSEVFSKARSINAGVVKSSGDLLVLHDADSFVAPAQLHAALDLAACLPEDAGRLIIPFSIVYYLTRETTDAVYAGRLPEVTQDSASYNALMVGGINVLTRKTFDRVGGFDARFQGHGAEDRAFNAACETLTAPTMRTLGALFHLWHPDDPTKNLAVEDALAKRYLMASGNADAMRELGAR